VTFLVLFALLAAAWGLQMYLTHRQAKAFLRAVRDLRAVGPTAIGVSSTKRVGRKTYVAVAAVDGRVASARELAGLTVWARPSSVPELAGRSLQDLADADEDHPRDKAAAMAASTLLSSAPGRKEGDDI
jgi:glucitol operon activator protein